MAGQRTCSALLFLLSLWHAHIPSSISLCLILAYEVKKQNGTLLHIKIMSINNIMN